ncbi:MORN repeat-containing protein 1-like [Cucumis melo var. makuwa]|uniref:MORN repeat-containing protein 1-like n=2 Tax=Cucumis melo TaxID=3656 RepID=A0A5D3C056_CUCMM|nr:MORN repeat-containing protein 1-like [Cucumis melo var. makuwa]TYK05197.1 MORN repeat-containing protein 1-like [Cucumis melo var. makuwa]
MDGQKNQAKLTRTQSSLLRSSPTVRSIQSLSSVTEEDVIETENEDRNRKNKKLRRSRSSARNWSMCFANPVLCLLLCFTLFSISCFFFFFYARKEEIATSENLLLALVFVAIALFFANKNKGLIQQTVSIMKHSWDENARRFGFSSTNAKPVKWFIGNPNPNFEAKKKRQIIREGVEFYSNGDFYEGEFHKGKSNGSGVYNYFANGRYEGDWIDGRYDGYGIESWARGSRYRGQYRQGLRHGFGVYRFYTGDSYAGEWYNGQSHGIGIQTCSDGSCYVGEFKHGAKHGLGCYHFRNGDRYAGEYFGDKIHGFGAYHFANGHCYEGSWHEGQKQGFGMYTFRNIESRCGEWDAGHLKNPVLPLTDLVLGAVQSARKTAQNAIKIEPVDEEVNKAVVAANRAANAARVAAVKAVQNRMKGEFCDIGV